MSKIRLEDGTIEYQGQWLTSEALAKMIQDRIQAGDLKVAELAVALEQLNSAIENTHILEESLVLSKEDYTRLLQTGGGDEKESVRQAIMAFIGKKEAQASPMPFTPKNEQKTLIRCSNCNQQVEVPSNERPIVVECSGCGTSCRLTL